MKKQRFNWMLAAILTICSATMTLTSCKDDEVVPETASTGVEQAETPTADALNVTTDKSYVIYGELEHGFDLALQRRLQGSMTPPMDADCFIFDMAALKQSSLSLDEWKEMVRRCQSGEASYVITQCSFKDFYDFAVIYILTAMAIELDNYQGDADPDAQAEAKARAKQRMANVVRNAYMASAQAGEATTRGTEVNNQELDWENIDQWPEEKQNAIMFDAYAFCGGNEIYVLNAEASKYMKEEEEADQPDNDYEWGQKADAIADWLNRQGKDDAETRSGLSDFRRAVTRAEGSTAISDLMNAQTKEFVFDYKYPSLWNKYERVCTAYSAIKVQYSAYSAYDFSGNVEYYQVRQKIAVMNEKIFSPNSNNCWHVRELDGDYNSVRGAWMKSIDTKMWLEGNDTKSVISAAPLNENGTSSGSSTTGGSTATTDGWSTSYGSSIGGSAGYMTLAFSYTFNCAYTTDHSTTNEISWNTSTNWQTKDLTTTFTQGNDANGTVTWKHNGYTPHDYNSTESNNVKSLLKGTCTTDEQTLWRIQNPSGRYTLRANFNVVSEIVKMKDWDWNVHSFVSQGNPHDISFDLNAPNRYKAKWNNVIYDYGNITGDIQLTHYLDEYIEKAYGYNSANFCWADLFVTTEATADGSDDARAVFQTFKNSIVGMKVQLYQKGFRGKLVFGLKRDGETKLTDKIVLDVDDLYNVGETLTEEVNGYELTFKVTKKNQEVELTSVPNNFTGELVIPEQIGEGVHLRVTSLGNNSAVRRKGITAVTIPGTLRTIGFGALAELNITKINIPEGVQTVSSWSFNTDKQLTKVYLPSTVTEIKNHAFYQCDAITEVHIKATIPPSVGSCGFNPAYQNATLHVPTGYKDTYANADYWRDFENIVEE